MLIRNISSKELNIFLTICFLFCIDKNICHFVLFIGKKFYNFTDDL